MNPRPTGNLENPLWKLIMGGTFLMLASMPQTGYLDTSVTPKLTLSTSYDQCCSERDAGTYRYGGFIYFVIDIPRNQELPSGISPQGKAMLDMGAQIGEFLFGPTAKEGNFQFQGLPLHIVKNGWTEFSYRYVGAIGERELDLFVESQSSVSAVRGKMEIDQ